MGVALTPEQNSLSAQNQMAFQERMSNTAHQREVADLKAAGLNPVLSAHGQGASTPSGAEGDIGTDQLEQLLGAVIDTNSKAVQGMSDAINYYASDGKSGSNNEWLPKTKEIAGQIGNILRYKTNGDINWTGTAKNLLLAYANGDLDSLPEAIRVVSDAAIRGVIEGSDLASIIPGLSGEQKKEIRKSGKMSLDEVEKKLSGFKRFNEYYYKTVGLFDPIVGFTNSLANIKKAFSSRSSGSGGYGAGFSGSMSTNSGKSYSNSYSKYK